MKFLQVGNKSFHAYRRKGEQTDGLRDMTN